MEHSARLKSFSSARIAFIAMFSAFAALLYTLGFSVPIAFPGFLEFKFSDVPTLIGSFALGPCAGAIIVVLEILIKLAIKGTSTVFVGELSDLATSCALVVVAGMVYKRHRSFRGVLAAIGVGSACEIAVALILNRVVLVPFYVAVFFGGRWEPLIGMITPIFPGCTRETFYNFYLWGSILPFNLLRCIISASISLLVYKRISRLITAVNVKIYGKPDRDIVKEKKINIAFIIAAAVIVALLITFTLLHYFVF